MLHRHVQAQRACREIWLSLVTSALLQVLALYACPAPCIVPVIVLLAYPCFPATACIILGRTYEAMSLLQGVIVCPDVWCYGLGPWPRACTISSSAVEAQIVSHKQLVALKGCQACNFCCIMLPTKSAVVSFMLGHLCRENCADKRQSQGPKRKAEIANLGRFMLQTGKWCRL